MKYIIALMMALAEGAAASAQPTSSSLAQTTPEQTTAGLAGAAFVEVCMERLGAVKDGAEYAHGATEMGRELKQKMPQLAPQSTAPVDIGGVSGDTCRVVYRGPSGDTLWTTFSDFHINKMNGDCVEKRSGPNSMSLICAANQGNPGYEQQVERENDKISIAIVWRSPKLP